MGNFVNGYGTRVGFPFFWPPNLGTNLCQLCGHYHISSGRLFLTRPIIRLNHSLPIYSVRSGKDKLAESLKKINIHGNSVSYQAKPSDLAAFREAGKKTYDRYSWLPIEVLPQIQTEDVPPQAPASKKPYSGSMTTYRVIGDFAK